jgi:predicted HicB family RNase H-like nuclease
MPTSKPKPKKPGRPRLAKAEAKGSIMPVRFSPEDRKRIEAAAKASNKTVSEWIRSTLLATIGA